MEYLCLVYGESGGTGLPDSVDGRSAGGMRRVEPGVNVRVRNGRIGVTQGALPSVAQLTAFFILEARDLNDAIRIAATEPAAGGETIEVHPLECRILTPTAALGGRDDHLGGGEVRR